MVKVNGRLVICPENPSHVRIWRKGLVPSRHGARQRYVCVDCGATFHAAQEIEEWPPKSKKRVKACGYHFKG